MPVKFPKYFNLRFAKNDAPTYHGMVKSAKENPDNRLDSLTEELITACKFYLKYKDRVKELEETEQS